MPKDNLRGTLDTADAMERMFMRLLGAFHPLGHPVETLTPAADEVAFMRLLIVNVCLLGRRGGRNWVLVDAGLPGSARYIAEAAGRMFGPESRPDAIVLTHGHFDHVGAVVDLVRRWDVPVYAHPAELPYLTGQADYMEPDPSTDEGWMAKIAPLYPNKAIDLDGYVRPLPGDGSVPGLADWQWVHTPGHTPGHVCFWRPGDKVLLAGDALTMVKQESAAAVASQKKAIHGPPKYFTPDWEEARGSVRKMALLRPDVLVPSHGLPERGDSLRRMLAELADEFDRLAVPHK